jgi:pilus assembly protein Flp/PilA
MHTLVRFTKDESAATAIEYCIIASLISIVILLAVNDVGTKLNATFTSVSTALK